MDINSNITISDNASSLKYEKTQNRDIVGTIERINRSQKFKPVSQKILDFIGGSASDFATREFNRLWRNKSDSHENPKNLNIEVSIGSPIYRRTDDSSYYYTMTITTIFSVDCIPFEKETDVEAEMRMSSWFFENIASSLNKKVVENMKSLLDSDDCTKNLMEFTLLQKTDEDKDKDEGKIGSKKSVCGKINISYMSSLKSKKNESSNLDAIPFRDNELVREGLISNIAMAVERIDSNPVETPSNENA